MRRRDNPLRMVAMVCVLLGTFAALAVAQSGADKAVDSLPPVFQNDSTNFDAIRKVDAGVAGKDSIRTTARNDSLRSRLSRRGPYVGLSAGVAFTEHSARSRFSSDMVLLATTANQRILQSQDPVHVAFPVGLVAGIPLFSHFDLILRSEHSYYRVTGLAQKDNEAAKEYWYVNQTHLAGAGLRWHVPVSVLTVSGQGGLYVGYTHFWNFGPTGIRAPNGNVAARFNPAGAGLEIQTGFQQNFDKRWAMTGGFSYARFSFASDGAWANVTPAASISTPEETASWTVGSMRFALQGLYQFGRLTK